VSTDVPWQHVHFTGIGGVGMSGLAHILLDWQVEVSGTDVADSATLQHLSVRGATVSVPHDADAVDGADLLVHSSAVQPDNAELIRAHELGIRTIRRGAFLADVTSRYPKVVAVAGSHGKTTTAAMLAHVLQLAGFDPGFLVGGEILGQLRPARAGLGDILVTEVDESDGTQALVRSSHAVVLNVDDDHCWSLGGVDALERCFIEFARRGDQLFAWDCPALHELLGDHPCVQFVNESASPAGMRLRVPGVYYRLNAAMVCSVAARLGVPSSVSAEALASFQGVGRRLTRHIESPDGRSVLVEDYAHHPTELSCTLRSLRDTYPGHALSVVFQPHRFERIKRYAGAFGDALGAADDVTVVSPFAAWCDDSELADPREVAEAVRGGAHFSGGSLADMVESVWERVMKADRRHVLAVIGAGDVTRAVPLFRDRIVNACLERFLEALRYALPHVRADRLSAWAGLTTLGVGEGHPLVVRPTTNEGLRSVLRFSHEWSMPVRVLGRGSNLVGTDRPDLCLWLRFEQGEYQSISRGSSGASLGAGVTLSRGLEQLGNSGDIPAGLMPLACIPGTVGGAVRVNAGADGVCIGEHVLSVRGLGVDGQAWERSGAAVSWGYRCTDIPADVVLTEVVLRRGSDDSGTCRKRLNEAREARCRRQPVGRSAGSVFRNPPGNSAGQLIEMAGCKGLRVGGCQVSEKHANWFLADKGASESDVIELLLRVQREVFRRSVVVLAPEVEFAGDEAGRVVRQTAWLREECQGELIDEKE
jgi:UDP-N-acetylmuramate--alanine ligase